MKLIKTILKAFIFIATCSCLLVILYAAISFIKFGLEKLVN